MLLAGVAYAVPNWRRLLRTIHAPALMLPLYWLLLDESPRWLATRGRRADAARVLRKAARWNGIVLDENALASLEKTNESSVETTREHTGETGPWRRLVRSRALMARLALCSCCWAATSFVYYGLTINSVSLSERKHVDFALNMLMEVVASLLLAMALERFGRRKSILTALFACGVVCVLPYFISHGGVSLGLFLAGKLAVTFAFNGLYIHTTELFPTETRSSALSACSLVGRVGSILAPQTPLLVTKGRLSGSDLEIVTFLTAGYLCPQSVYVQAALFGGVAMTAALLLLLAPETRRAPLPDTAAAAAALGRQQIAPAPVR
ncbi:hypothetical protein EVAR_54236_1 [Eumeta japonica]|uniref:Major facilitator superfamily (MFS) profile domain-containing protein n=1 Tax=Eumeta variegata TaxID=151549 RepID=A0A4C1YWG3_EUMVA|nr:hypothetical protein EVAR_54236_1 [Eumeta japonica]